MKKRSYKPMVSACWRIVEEWASVSKPMPTSINRLVMAMKEFDNEHFLAILTTTSVKLHTKEEEKNYGNTRDNAHGQSD